MLDKSRLLVAPATKYLTVEATPSGEVKNKSPKSEPGDESRYRAGGQSTRIDFSGLGAPFVGTGQALDALLTLVRTASPSQDVKALSASISVAVDKVVAELKRVRTTVLSEIEPGFPNFDAAFTACALHIRSEVARVRGEVLRHAADGATRGCDRLITPKTNPWDAAERLASEALEKAEARGKAVAIVDVEHSFVIVARPGESKAPADLVKEAETLSTRTMVGFPEDALQSAIYQAKSVVDGLAQVDLAKGGKARDLDALKEAYGWTGDRWFMKVGVALREIRHPDEIAAAAKALVELGPAVVADFFSSRILSEDPGLALIWGRAVRDAGGQVQASTLFGGLALSRTAYD